MVNSRPRTGAISRIGERQGRAQQLEDELSNLKKSNATQLQINRRTSDQNRQSNVSKAVELTERCAELQDNVRKMKLDNAELEREIQRKQAACAEAERKLAEMKQAAAQQQLEQTLSEHQSEAERLQLEFDALSSKKKELLEHKNAKDEEHRVLKDNLKDYLHDLQQKYMGYLFNGSIG